MSHPDTSWRLAAIYRCCVRYGMTREIALQKVVAVFRVEPWPDSTRVFKAEQLVNIWFRDGRMDREIEDFKQWKATQ